MTMWMGRKPTKIHNIENPEDGLIGYKILKCMNGMLYSPFQWTEWRNTYLHVKARPENSTGKRIERGIYVYKFRPGGNVYGNRVIAKVRCWGNICEYEDEILYIPGYRCQNVDIVQLYIWSDMLLPIKARYPDLVIRRRS